MKKIKLWYPADEHDYPLIKATNFTYFPEAICQPQFGRDNKKNPWDRSIEVPLFFRVIPRKSFATRLCRLYRDEKTHTLLYFEMDKDYIETYPERPIDGAGRDASTFYIGIDYMAEFNSNLASSIKEFKTYNKKN